MYLPADKSAMRRAFKAKRDDYVAKLPNTDAAISFSALPSPLRSLFSAAKTVAAYIAIGSEANPRALLRFAHDAGCMTALPHVTGRAAPMCFRQWQMTDPLIAGPFGLQQPIADAPQVTPDVILVPLVAFDRRLNRLGQGAGHYDRALSIIDNVIAIGVAWSVQEADLVPADPWDIPLSAILTEKEWISR
mgnify:CR=1 FL=1